MAIASDFNSRPLIQSDSYPKGITSTESIQNYTVNLYPGISHFKFNPPCDVLSITHAGALHLWLNKTNDNGNLPENNRTEKPLSYYKFTLPISLNPSFSPIIARLNKFNQGNRSEFSSWMRKYRKILNTEKGFITPKGITIKANELTGNQKL